MFTLVHRLCTRLGWVKPKLNLEQRRAIAREKAYAQERWGNYRVMESRRWTPTAEGFQRKVLLKNEHGHHDFYLAYVKFQPNTDSICEQGYHPWDETEHGKKPKLKTTPNQAPTTTQPCDPFDL